MSVEAYQTLMLRDVYAETRRNATDWILDLRVYCETADIGVPYSGTWTIRLSDTSGEMIQPLLTDSIVLGDQDREASVDFQLNIAADQVKISRY